MKKLMLLLLICGSICVSCNKDDDDSNPEVNVSEKIVGHWTLNRREISGLMEDLEVCELSTNIDFLGNGNFQVELFMGDDLEDCQSASNSGTWEYIGEDKINVQFTSQVEPTLFRVSFSDNFSKLVLIEYENGDIVQLEEYIRG